MVLVLKDRVKETTTVTGTGAATLAGSVDGFQAFSAVLSDADTTYYAISHRSENEWEVGLGTYSASTLTRTTVLESSSGGSAVSFTAGTKDVFITLPAEKAVALDSNDDLSVGNIITTGYLRGPATFTIDPAAHGDNTGTLVVAGNLQVDGTTTTVNSTSLAVTDLNITVANGAANAAAADGAGLTADGANATFTYDATNDRWAMNKSLDTDLLGDVTGTVSDISNHSTTDLSEGTNLYYTTARFDSALSAKTTADLTEGSNLYYTTARFDAALSAKTTTDLTEGSNLYYTTARFDSALSGKTTSDVTEGSNLYYTAARVNSAIDTRVDTAFVDALNVDAETLGGSTKTTILADAEAKALALAIALG